MKLPVQITIEAFKPSGKYYSTYYLVAPVTHIYNEEENQPVTHYMDDAVEAVKKEVREGRLPSEFHLRITTECGYPVLIPNEIKHSLSSVQVNLLRDELNEHKKALVDLCGFYPKEIDTALKVTEEIEKAFKVIDSAWRI